MIDLDTLLSEAPLSINDDERKAINSLCRALAIAGHNGSTGLAASIASEICPALQVVIASGLRAIDEGLIVFKAPPS